MKKLLILLCLFVGCVTPNWQPHGSVVTIRQPHSVASGVVIGENLVITAAHCVDEPGYIKIRASKNPLKRYTEFHKLASMVHKYESIICLYGPFEFSKTAIFKVGCEDNLRPFMVQTRRGLFEMTEFNSQPGDSGSAVICKDGHLLGVHWGRTTIGVGKQKKKIPLFLLFKD